MGKKIALNVCYNLALIISIIAMGWAYQNNSWLVVAFFAGTFLAILFFKIQLVKDLRKELKK